MLLLFAIVRRLLARKLAARRFGGAFGVQAAVSVAGLALGAGMLASGRGEAAVYLPVVTSIIGYWLPAPRPCPSDSRDASSSSVGSVASVADRRRRRSGSSDSSSASDKTA